MGEKGDLEGRVDRKVVARAVHLAGQCRARLGRFEDALVWLRRALADLDPADQDFVGRAWHLVGDCHARRAEMRAAFDAYERAIACKERGDETGAIYADSLGESLAALGFWLSRTHAHAHALPHLRRAADVLQHGLSQGRVEPKLMADTMSELAVCLEATGELVEATAWGARAAAMRVVTQGQ